MKKKFAAALMTFSMLSGFTLTGLAQQAPSDADQLHQAFVDPPRDFSLMPFWFWNGKMDGPVIQQEIRDMVDQHVYGAFLHARDGLETPYLSEEWFKAIGAGLEQSKQSGFEFNFVDEYDWPSGEARNIWMAGNHQSEVLARRPDLRMKSLAWEATFAEDSRPVDITIAPDSQAVVAARWLGENRIDSSTLTRIDAGTKDGKIHWTPPAGNWVVVQFSLEPTMGFDGGFVDLMNPDSTNLFFKLVYGEYHKRFPSYFGSTIHYSFADHEGDYGRQIAWTSKLYTSFEQRNGYDLRKMLPLLIYDGGNVTTKLRADYLATITDLYGNSFWAGLTKSVSDLGIGRTGHAWEESLQWAAALEGNLFTVERGLNPVGVDSLGDFGRQPLNFKVAQSVADYEGRRFACENQGVQGTDSYLDLEGIRKGTNGIGAWGVNLFIPHAFDYDKGRANYPPDWLHQPYWPYFHTYADYTRRISYMNADSHHVTNVLLYYPITTMWADTAPLFSGSTDYQSIGRPVAWKNQTVLINDYYSRIINGLAERQWDYNIADDQYLAGARVEGNELVIGPQRFRAIVLPPLTVLSRTTLKKLQEFHDAGGTIIGIRLLPTSSPEAGGDDQEIKDGIASLFPATTVHGKDGGGVAKNSFYIQDSVDQLIDTLDANVPKDVRVASGPQEHLYFQHRIKAETGYYWVVNDTDHSRTNTVHFSAKGVPEKWDALTGKREQLFYTNAADGTDVRLNLSAWDAFYVVFRPLTASPQTMTLEATNAFSIDNPTREGAAVRVHLTGAAGTFVKLRSGEQTYRGTVAGTSVKPLTLDGDWQFKPQPKEIAVPYARVSDASATAGQEQGWSAADFDDSGWPEMWLNQEQTTIRHWQMIGPFPNPDNNGYAKAFPPEQAFDAAGKYEGSHGPVGWEDYNGNEPYLALNNWDILMKSEGGANADDGYIVNFNPELYTDGQQWIVSYAHTYLYSPREQHAQFILAADNWASVWLNGQKVYGQLRTPFWYEYKDDWSDKIAVDLHKGWNEVLVKVGKARGTATGIYGFTLRVADEQGAVLQDVTTSPTRLKEEQTSSQTDETRWYRVTVPPGGVAVVPPALHKPYKMLINGRDLQAEGNAPIDLHHDLQAKDNSLVIIASKDDPLTSPIRFVTGETPFKLTSWTKTGLANFSGTAIYSKSFTLPADFGGKHIMLDLGKVSSVAEVYINDQPAGTLVWDPYRLDVTKLLKPGRNIITIVVTNTEANQRAVGTSRNILSAIDICGLEGPVQLIPYFDTDLSLHP